MADENVIQHDFGSPRSEAALVRSDLRKAVAELKACEAGGPRVRRHVLFAPLRYSGAFTGDEASPSPRRGSLSVLNECSSKTS
jgi:hypothetical protein